MNTQNNKDEIANPSQPPGFSPGIVRQLKTIPSPKDPENPRAKARRLIRTGRSQHLICHLLVMTFFAIALVGCAAEPFQQPPLPVLTNPDPQGIREKFPTLLPDEFTTDDTLILQFPFHDDLVMLGVLNVNRSAGTVELYALNQMGVPYFHLSGDGKGVSVRDALGPWLEHKDILLAIARDMQHIYLNPSPDAGATVDISPTHIDFNQKAADGTVAYQFGMEPTVLLQKQLDGFFGATWRARYYDYRPGIGGKLFPRDIVMDNSAYHYRLIIKNRDWSIDEKE